MSWRSSFIEILKSELNRRKQKNPSYSLRSFAQQLGVGSGPLSEIISGARVWNFSASWAFKILKHIQLPRHQRNQLLLQMGLSPDVEIQISEIELQNKQVISDWRFFAVLLAFDLFENGLLQDDLIRRLSLSIEEYDVILRGLAQSGLLSRDVENKNKLRRKPVLLRLNGLDSDAVREHQNQNLKLASQALEKRGHDHLNFQTLTFVGSRDGFKNLVIEIDKLILKASAIVDQGEKNDQVYRLAVQCFPLA